MNRFTAKTPALIAAIAVWGDDEEADIAFEAALIAEDLVDHNDAVESAERNGDGSIWVMLDSGIEFVVAA
jgi:hypothetical protein